MALQAAVKDDLWRCALPDATVAAPDGGEWRGFGVGMRERIDLLGIRGEKKTKGAIAGFFSCTAEEIRA